jgi:D-alanyl-D-alanine carboxypeptidase
MKTHNFFIILIAVLFFACKKEDAQEQKLEKIQQAIEAIVAEEFDAMAELYPQYPGGFIMQVQTGKHHFFAHHNINGEAGKTVHFRAASNTKTFTSTAILLLHQQGKLDIRHHLTDIIPQKDIQYLPENQEYDIPFKSQITILDLMRHRAGVFDITNDLIPDTITADVPYKGQHYLSYIMENNPTHSFSLDQLIQVVAETGLYYFEPGTDYHYSNTGYSILAKIIERASGMSYGDFMHQNIAAPMGLANTTFPFLGTDQQLPAPFLPGYILINDEIFDVTESNVSGNIAEGNIITTTDDLFHFLRTTLRGEGLLTPYTVNSIMMNVIPVNNSSSGAYGCGLSFTKNLGYGHSGAHEGYLSIMTYDPADDITIVMVTNTWNLSDGLNTIIEQLNGLMQNIGFRTKYYLKDQKL